MFSNGHSTHSNSGETIMFVEPPSFTCETSVWDDMETCELLYIVSHLY